VVLFRGNEKKYKKKVGWARGGEAPGPTSKVKSCGGLRGPSQGSVAQIRREETPELLISFQIRKEKKVPISRGNHLQLFKSGGGVKEEGGRGGVTKNLTSPKEERKAEHRAPNSTQGEGGG